MYIKVFRIETVGLKNYGLLHMITESRHDANFVVTGTTSDDKAGILTILVGFSVGYCVDHLTRLTVIGEQIADNCYCLSENYGPKQHNAQQPKSGITLVLFQDVMFDYMRWSSTDGSAVASVNCFMFLCQKVTFQCQNPVAFGFGFALWILFYGSLFALTIH